MKSFTRWMFPLGLMLLFSVSAIGVWCIYSLRQAVYFEHASTRIHDKADEINNLVQAAVTYQRSYLLTGNKTFLTDYDEVPPITSKKIDELIQLYTKNNPENKQESISEIRSLIDSEFAELRKTSDLLTLSKRHPPVIGLNLENGQNLINQIRYRLNFIKEESKKIAEEHSSFIRNYSTLLSILISLGSLLSISLLLANLIMTKKQIKIREMEKEEIAQARALAQESSDLKSKFLATVSHEVRTPLNGIIGLSDVLRKSNLPASEHHYVEVIHNSGKTLLKIINDILDFSRIETGKLEFEMSEFDLKSIAEQVIDTLSAKAVEKSIFLSTVLDDNLPRTLFGDPSRLSQILFNIVGNAVKFTSAGSIILKIKKDLTSTDSCAMIIFSIEDTGLGMSSEQMTHLFQPFHQIHKVGTSGEPGTGLGLSIAQYLVRAMGGEIKVSSELDRGSKFWFVLPFNRFSKEKIVQFQEKRNLISPIVQTQIQPLFENDCKPTVLVVEDNVANQITIQTILNRLGLDVILASNGNEAIDLSSKTQIDLVLMDCQMPVMDGFESTKILKKNRFQAPIIAMTANASKEDEKACMLSGMDGFIAKPVTIDVLSEKLIRFLKPDPCLISSETLRDLEDVIGFEGKQKVIEAYLNALPELRIDIEKCLEFSDVDKLKRIGHKYKSSSLTVGAIGFSFLCNKLERETSEDRIIRIANKIKSTSYDIENKFSKEKSYIY